MSNLYWMSMLSKTDYGKLPSEGLPPHKNFYINNSGNLVLKISRMHS